MRLVRTLGALAVATALSTTAQAADLGTPDPAMAYASPAFDWTGFYAGLGVTGGMFNPSGNTVGSIGVVAGANVQVDSFVLGAEAMFGFYRVSTGSQGWIVNGEVRAGYLLADEVLLYAALAGKGYSAGARYAGIGAGVEFAVTDDISVDFEAVYYPWSNNASTQFDVAASVLWHF